MESITIPDSIASIGTEAFCGCRCLDSIDFIKPSRVVSIGERAFCGCGWLHKITIPDSVTSIGEKVFFKCRHVSNVEMPERFNRQSGVEEYYGIPKSIVEFY